MEINSDDGERERERDRRGCVEGVGEVDIIIVMSEPRKLIFDQGVQGSLLSHLFRKLTMVLKTIPLSKHDFLVFHGMTELPSVMRLAKEAKEAKRAKDIMTDVSDIKAKRAKLAKEAKEANKASEAFEALNQEDKEALEDWEAAEAADAADNARKGKCQTKISEYFDIVAIYRPSLTCGPSLAGA